LKVQPEYSLQKHPARSFQALRVHPAAFFRAEKSDHAANVLGDANSPKRSLRGQKILHPRIVIESAAREVRLDGAGRHDVAGNATRPQLLRQIPRKYLDSALH